MERVEQAKQSFVDFMKPNKQQQNSFHASWTPSGEASSALSKSSSSVGMPSDGNIAHNIHGHSHGSSILSESSTESGPLLKEHDYIGLAEVSSASSSASGDEGTSDVEDTDLRLGPGPLKEGLRSLQHEQKAQPFLELLEAKEKIKGTSMAYMDGLTSTAVVLPLKNGFKRVYGETLSEMTPGVNVASAVIAPFKQSQGSDFYVQKNVYLPNWPVPSSNALYASTDTKEPEKYESEVAEPPPAKGQVVGWPPIRSYRRNTLTGTHVTQPGLDGDGCSAVYVKVNMDGIPIGRKVDLNVYRSYETLLAALEEMFNKPSSGNGVHFLSNGEFALTYEDKDGDWMLVGDVPWGMFVNTVRRLRIVRGSEAKGLGMHASYA